MSEILYVMLGLFHSNDISSLILHVCTSIFFLFFFLEGVRVRSAGGMMSGIPLLLFHTLSNLPASDANRVDGNIEKKEHNLKGEMDTRQGWEGRKPP